MKKFYKEQLLLAIIFLLIAAIYILISFEPFSTNAKIIIWAGYAISLVGGLMNFAVRYRNNGRMPVKVPLNNPEKSIRFIIAVKFLSENYCLTDKETNLPSLCARFQIFQHHLFSPGDILMPLGMILSSVGMAVYSTYLISKISFR
jgi:hypothetical protein